MPFFYDQSRSDLRRMYRAAWRKRLDRRPMEPLEAQIASVIEIHPEYQDWLAEELAVEQEFTPQQGVENPFLHMALHLGIREQVSTDRPRGIAEVHAALARRLGDAHAAEHVMLECLGEALWRSQRGGLPPDETAYLEALRKL